MSKRQTPMQEAHTIVWLLIHDYLDQGQPHNDYDPNCEWHRPECKGGKRRADAVARALNKLADNHVRRT